MVCDHCSSESHATGYQNCPNYCTVCKDARHRRYSKACPNRTCPDRVCSSCNSSLHKTSKSSDCPYHQCSTCDEIGHSKKHCPQAECGVCNLFGHVDTICPFRDCWDVAIDWLNILLMCRTQFTIGAYFSDGEVTCSLNDLRIDGILREFADWQQVQDLCALDGTQIMELKRASLLFKRNPPPKIVLPEFLCRLSQCIALRNCKTSYLSYICFAQKHGPQSRASKVCVAQAAAPGLRTPIAAYPSFQTT
jgi:hypothetical protein